jgi:hypothetical protein
MFTPGWLGSLVLQTPWRIVPSESFFWTVAISILSGSCLRRGALLKSFEQTRVVPLLFELRISDLKGPLAQFQAKVFSEEGMIDIVKSVNSTLQSPLEARILERSFARGWPEIKQRVEETQSAHALTGRAIASREADGDQDSVRDALEELLTLARSQNQLLASIVAKRGSSELRRDIEVLHRRILRMAKRQAEK